MNISGIPQLHAAAGFSSGEAAHPAKSHQIRTLQEVRLSPYWLQHLRRRSSEPKTGGRAH